jgi:MraZ protein
VGNFFGTYSRTLDEKNRLQLPSKLVEQKNGHYFVLRGFEGCLSIYEEAEFQKLLEKLQALDYLDETNRAYVRLAAASANELDVDSHGRLCLGQQLVDDYRIGKSVTVIGVLDHFEVWDATSYAKYLLEHSSSYEALAARSAH